MEVLLLDDGAGDGQATGGGGEGGGSHVKNRILTQEAARWLRSSVLVSSNSGQHAKEDRWRLLYNSRAHGASFSTMLGRIAGLGSRDAHGVMHDDDAMTILCVKTKDAQVFGCFASKNWEVRGEYYGDHRSALFSLGRLKKAASAEGGGGGGGGNGALDDAFDESSFRLWRATGYNDNFQWLGRAFKTLPNGIGVGGQIHGAQGFYGLFIGTTASYTQHGRPPLGRNDTIHPRLDTFTMLLRIILYFFPFLNGPSSAEFDTLAKLSSSQSARTHICVLARHHSHP